MRIGEGVGENIKKQIDISKNSLAKPNQHAGPEETDNSVQIPFKQDIGLV